MGKFTLADWAISLAGAGVIAWIGHAAQQGIMMFISGLIVAVSVWRSIRRELDRRESHKMNIKEREKKLAREERWPFDPTEDSIN